MKKSLVLYISFILVLAMIFSVFSMGAAGISIKDNPIPLAGDFTFADDDEIAEESPKTGDNALLFVLGFISLTVACAAVRASKKSRVK